MNKQSEFSRYIDRRKELIKQIKAHYPHEKRGIVLLIADFEKARYGFRQESSFYYLTGVQEPGVAVVMDLDEHSILYVPNCAENRSRWVPMQIEYNQNDAQRLGFEAIVPIGGTLSGYHIGQFCHPNDYMQLINRIQQAVVEGLPIFTFNPETSDEYIDQRLILCRLAALIPGFSDRLCNISSVVANMRRKKDLYEIEQLYKSVEITALAQEAAAHSIEEGVTEAEVQASLEFMFTGSQVKPSFPSIVASGKNGTILHYTHNAAILKKGDLVIVDIGADYQYYASDITRTYPVSGTFTKRQRELYTIVLETQEYIASLAKPGYWLSNKEEPDRSLHHLAKAFLDQRGYGAYFPHGIGHYLGIDVHDVGSYTDRPLQHGDVFTIEPGIYIPHEHIGIRIEDDYWMTEKGLLCLSDYIPKSITEIESLMNDSQ